MIVENNSKKMNLPFETHTIFICDSLNKKIYKLNKDFSKEEVFEIPKNTTAQPIMVIQRISSKILLNKNLPKELRLSKGLVTLYNKIGFITDEELTDYLEN